MTTHSAIQLAIELAVVFVAFVVAVSFAAVGAYWWRNATRVAATRAEAFREDGWWVGHPWPWQRTARGVRVEAASMFVAASFMLVSVALASAGLIYPPG